jgi:tetratricopeptide (TPR) repeat protein
MRTLRLLLLLAGCSLALPTLASAEPVRVVPKYQVRGDVIDDPVQVKGERKAFEAAYEHYRIAAKEYRDEVREFIAREVGSRQKNISSSYQGQIDGLDQQQFDLRRDAIARLESFIYRHRDHETYTPDTLFRLAELYYEDTIASYNRSQDNFQREMDLYNRGKLLDPPNDVDRDFSRSIAIYKYLHWVPDGTAMTALSGKLEGLVLEKRWPNYKFSDVAMYLQGYCEYEGGDIDKSIATLSQLEAHYPKSTYISEAWLRVGEMYFDQSEFEQAAGAYQHAAERAFATNDFKNYSLALYKLGWSNFQLYKYPEAVRWFQKLIEFEDANADKIKQEKDRIDLRKEAIEYLAKSLAEPSWDDDGCDDFGNEDAKTACLTLDPRLRPRLYVASVLEPRFDDFPDWRKGLQGEAVKRLETNFEARNAVRKDLMNGKPYTYDILVTYGNTLFDQAQDDYYRQAVLVLGYVIEHWPVARESQALQRKIIRAVDILAAAAAGYAKQLERDKNDKNAQLGFIMAVADQDRQVVERRKYLAMFAKGSPWYEKWGSDKDLAAQVDDTVGRVRLDFAQLIHQQAQNLRRSGNEEAALAKYAEAATEYEKLLKDDPESPNAYELAWTLAETLFFAGKRCDALRTKDGSLMLVKDTDDQLVPFPAAAMGTLKTSCEYMKKSVAYYSMVRDWKGAHTRGEDGKPEDFKEQASFSAILASSLVLNARAAYPVGDAERLDAKEIPELRPSSKADEAEVEANKDAEVLVHVKPRVIDPATVEWLLAVDGYITANPVNPKEDPERIQKLALQAAELLYKNRQFDPNKESVTPRTAAEFWAARSRFWWLIQKYPISSQANEAYKDLIESYVIEHDYAEMDRATKYGDEHKIGNEIDRKKTRDAITEVGLGAMAKAANDLFSKAEQKVEAAEKVSNPEETGRALAEARATYEKSGDLYYELRNKITKGEKDYTSRQKAALMNAVRAYYRAEKWDECEKVLKFAEDMVRNADTKDPKEKDLNVKRLQEIIETRVDLEYKFFHIPEAIADYRLLYDSDPTGKKAAAYLKSAADLSYFNSNWDLAIQLDKQLVKNFDKDPKQREIVQKTAWRIQEDYQKKGDINGQIGALEEFITRYQTDKTMSGRVFRAYGMIADIYEGRGDRKNSEKMYHRILDAFEKGGFEKNGGAEASAAAQSAYMLMKGRYDQFMTMKLVENTKLPAAKRGPDLQNQLKGMLDIVLGPEKKLKKPDGTMDTSRGGGMFDEYLNSVATFGSRDWSYAAFLNRGRMLQYLARVIYAAPEPQGLTDEQLDEYHNFMDMVGGQIENQAIKSLEAALKDAEAKGVVNQWVADLRKAINQYKPKDYPLLKDEKRLSSDPVGTLPEPDKELR